LFARTVGRKLGFYLVTTWAAITVNFAIPRLMPGNAVDGFLGRIQGRLSGSALKALTATLGVRTHDSLLTQYLNYLNSIAHFRFGVSLTYYPEPVSKVVAQSLPWTLVLVGVSTIIAFIVGTVLGVLAGWRHGHKLDELLTPFGAFISSMPYFWFGLIVVSVFAIGLGWFPSYGGYDATQAINWSGAFLSTAFMHAVLPATTIIVTAMGAWLVGMRNMMVNTIGEDYITIARAKGLSEGSVMWRYAARNALLPNVAGFALSLGFVVAGAILTEVVFSYPGIGDVLYQAIANRDYPLMQAVFLIITLAVLAANLIADVVYVWLDPRARHGGRA
jgi:peptide/nickel transport system permease protein